MIHLTFREAKFQDAKQIYQLSNDKDVRENSINSNLIEWESHVKWLENKLKDTNYKILLFFCENHFVGQIKYEIDGKVAVISISLVSEFRGLGLTKEMFSLSFEFLFNTSDVVTIYALIKSNNLSSIKSFKKVGFNPVAKLLINNEDYVKYNLKKSDYENSKPRS